MTPGLELDKLVMLKICGCNREEAIGYVKRDPLNPETIMEQYPLSISPSTNFNDALNLLRDKLNLTPGLFTKEPDGIY